MKTACVVLVYGVDELHRRLIEQVISAGISPTEVAVVHNPSVQGETLPRSPAGVEVLEMDRNLGYAGAMNLGIRHQLDRGAERILMLTQDVRFLDRSLDALLAARAGYGILGPAIRWDAEITCYGGLIDGGGRAYFRQSPPPGNAAILDSEWVDGAAVLVDAAVFGRVGLLDERFFMYFEETELCLRARRAGVKVGVVRDAVIEQDHGYARRPELYAYLMTRNGLEFARRAAGWRGVVAGVGRTLQESWRPFRTAVGRRSTRVQRRQARGVLGATGRGLAAFGAGRFGAPPRSVHTERGG